MPNNWTVEITHYDISTTTTTVITDNFVALPSATDTGSTEINSATLILSAPKGKFITSAPLIDQFDRIRIKITVTGSSEYNKVFDVMKIIPSWTKSEGVRVTLVLQGMEHHLQKINHIKPFFYEGAKEVMEDVIDSYNNSKGSTQPTLLSVGTNELPNSNFTKNNYDFAINQDTCHNRMIDIIDRLGASVDDGGALDFYETRYTNSNSDFTSLLSNVFSSGSPSSGSEVTINDTSAVNVGESDAGIDSITGTVVHAWGAIDQGSLPVEFSQFKSGERRYGFYPLWSNSVDYVADSIVQQGDKLYKSILASGPSGVGAQQPPNTTYWTERTRNTDYGSIQYSQWTKSGAVLWKDGGIDPTNINSSSEIGPGFWDGNLIINDTQDNWFRTIADVRISASNPEPSDITGSATLKKYLYNYTHFYRGFRVLLQDNSAPGGTWSGTDINGKSFTQAIVECTSPGTELTAEWRVVYAATTDDLVCTIRDEGIIYKYDTTANTWTSGSMVTDGDHLHPYSSLDNVSGIPNIGDGTFANNTNSAIRSRWDYSQFDTLRSATDEHRIGAWLGMSFPYPTAKINGTVDVGFYYGGGITGRDSVCEPATLDAQNMHLTHDGYRGFNAQSDSSEDYGQISSIDFWMNMNYQSKDPILDPVYYTVETANFVITCLLVDTEDNVVSQDFVIKFNNQWDEYKLPISGFNIYRGRKPNDSLITTIIPPKELEISNIFRWRNVKHIIFQTKESYDEEGRYRTDELNNRYLQNTTQSGLPDLTRISRRIDLTIDALHFTKPLLANTGQDTTRCVENEFIEKPEIMDYYQLKNDAKAELEKRKFRHVEFDITTSGNADINFGDYFLYENENLIADEFETSSGSNKIRLVAKHIEYSITKPVNGKGGFLRRILGVRRFV